MQLKLFHFYIKDTNYLALKYLSFLKGPLPTTEEGYKYVCTFTDYFTKFVDFYPLRAKSADGVAKCIKTFTCR